MSTFRKRKAERTAYYEKYVKGWKLRPCTACNGSGYYDSFGSPYCGGCDGTGRERYKPDCAAAAPPEGKADDHRK